MQGNFNLAIEAGNCHGVLGLPPELGCEHLHREKQSTLFSWQNKPGWLVFQTID